MRLLIILLLAGFALGSDALFAQSPKEPAAQDRPAGSPGTATPHPFKPPQPRGLPTPAPGNPRLLKQPEGNLAPPDDELPLLEQQRQRNRQNPGKKAD